MKIKNYKTKFNNLDFKYKILNKQINNNTLLNNKKIKN